jgi:hypothetical protein
MLRETDMLREIIEALSDLSNIQEYLTSFEHFGELIQKESSYLLFCGLHEIRLTHENSEEEIFDSLIEYYSLYKNQQTGKVIAGKELHARA